MPAEYSVKAHWAGEFVFMGQSLPSVRKVSPVINFADRVVTQSREFPAGRF
jgi:hypothetical protein